MAALNGTRTHGTSVGCVAELLGDRVGHRRLESLAVGGDVADEPGRVGGLIGAEGQGCRAATCLQLRPCRTEPDCPPAAGFSSAGAQPDVTSSAAATGTRIAALCSWAVIIAQDVTRMPAIRSR